MLNHITIDNLFGIDDLSVNALVGGAFYTDGGHLFFKIGDAFLWLRHDDFNVVGGIGREDEVDILQTNVDAGGKDLLHAAFKDEMPLRVSLVLVKQNAGFVEEIFVDKKPHQGFGFVTSPRNSHILSI